MILEMADAEVLGLRSVPLAVRPLASLAVHVDEAMHVNLCCLQHVYKRAGMLVGKAYHYMTESCIIKT